MNKRYITIFFGIIIVMFLLCNVYVTNTITNSEIRKEHQDYKSLEMIQSKMKMIVEDEQVNEYITSKLVNRDRVNFWMGSLGEISLDELKKNHGVIYEEAKEYFKDIIQLSSQASLQNNSTFFLSVTNDGKYCIMESIDGDNPIVGTYTDTIMKIEW